MAKSYKSMRLHKVTPEEFVDLVAKDGQTITADVAATVLGYQEGMDFEFLIDVADPDQATYSRDVAVEDISIDEFSLIDVIESSLNSARELSAEDDRRDYQDDIDVMEELLNNL